MTSEGGLVQLSYSSLVPWAASLCLALVATGASAQTSTGEPGFSPDAIRADVTFLADDLLEGRQPGTRGYDLAALYVTARFTELGLTPAGEHGGWLQNVRLQEHRIDPAHSTVTISGPQGADTWQHATHVVITANPSATRKVIEAPVVFAGFGIDAPRRGFNDYRGLDVRGKIVAVLIGTPKGTPSEMGAHLNASKATMAQRRGAIGMIMLDTREVRALYPVERRLENDTQPRTTWLDRDGRPVIAAPDIQATAALDETAANALFASAPRSLNTVLDQADRPNGRPKGFALPARARIEWQSSTRTYDSANVLGLLPGTDPALGQQTVVMMAHLDHVGRRSPKHGDDIVNGALDNAAGVAIMLDVARAMAGSTSRPRRSILFLANTAEEPGLLGTHYFTAAPTVPLDRIVGVLNLDVPLVTYEFSDVIGFGADHSTLGVNLARVAGATGVTVTPDPVPAQGLFTRSDHYAMVQKGIPALFLIPGYAGGGQQAWQTYLSQHYHQPSDDLSQPLNWQAAARFARINWLLLRDVANDAERPRWYEGSYFGETFAPDAPKAVKR